MIYVCIPSRDEAATLGPLLWKVRRVMRDFGRDFHLVVFDDGSSDDTRAVLDRYHNKLPLTVLGEESPLGYGGAVDKLLAHVVEVSDYPKRDAAVVLQGDLTEDPEYLADLVRTIEGGADIVAGAAPDAGPDVPRSFRWGRRLAPLVLGSTYRAAPVEDPLCGLRAYRVIVLRKASRENRDPFCSAAEPWVASLELLRRLVPFARRIETLPLTIRYGLLARESRFRAWPTLKRLLSQRSGGWPERTHRKPPEDKKGDGEERAA